MKNLFLTLMAVAAIALTSCNNKPTVETLSGSWVMTEMTWDVQGNDTSAQYVIVLENNLEMRKSDYIGHYGYVLSEDGKIATSDGDHGTWELSNNIVSITTYFGEESNTVQFKYKDGELVWVDDRLAGNRNQDLKDHGITKYVVTMHFCKGEFAK